jgi:hypothetical protein
VLRPTNVARLERHATPEVTALPLVERCPQHQEPIGDGRHRIACGRGGVLMVFLLIIGAIGIAAFGAALGAVFTFIYFSKGLRG